MEEVKIKIDITPSPMKLVKLTAVVTGTAMFTVFCGHVMGGYLTKSLEKIEEEVRKERVKQANRQ